MKDKEKRLNKIKKKAKKNTEDDYIPVAKIVKRLKDLGREVDVEKSLDRVLRRFLYE